MSVTIWHNPKCGTSRNTLALIRERGVEPVVIEYLKTPPTRAELVALIAEAGLTPRQVLRAREVEGVGIDVTGMSDDALLDAMIAHPILIQRPLVKSPKGVRLSRPPETVLDIL
jgi:arsenate reductase